MNLVGTDDGVDICRGVDSFLNPGGWQSCEGHNAMFPPVLNRVT